MSAPDCPTRIYYWPRNFVMRSSRYEQALRERHYQRLSATLIINAMEPFRLQVDDQPPRDCHLALLSPNTRRQQLIIPGGDGFMFDVDITTDLYARLRNMLPVQGIATPSEDVCKALLDHIGSQRDFRLSADNAIEFFDGVMTLLTVHSPVPKARDERIDRILRIVDQSSRDEVSVAGLAKTVGLSESRLRSLVQKELGCSLSRYLRWAAAWKTAALWQPGVTLTEVAHAAGFHDLSHANRTFVELFGLSPTRFLKSDQIQMQRCQLA